MNKIDFSKPGGFPFTQDTLRFMQSAYADSLGAIAAWLGDKVVLSGCVKSNNVVGSGFVAINGEILPTAGGSASTVFISNENQSVIFENGQETQVYANRKLVFGVGEGQMNWSEFKYLRDIPDMTSYLVPKGAIMMWAGTTPPTGWALCNGENDTPNLSGRFIVGYGKASQYRDENPSYYIGNTGGETKHTLASWEIPAHSHSLNMKYVGYRHSDGGTKHTPIGEISPNVSQERYGETNITGSGYSHENRPPYYVLAYIQKL